MLPQRDFGFLGVIESSSFEVLVGLRPNPSGLFFALASNFHFEVSYHLNDHYYNSTIYSLHQKFIKSYHVVSKNSKLHPSPPNHLPQVLQVGTPPNGIHQLSLSIKNLSIKSGLLLCMCRIRSQETQVKLMRCRTKPLKMVVSEAREQSGTPT